MILKLLLTLGENSRKQVTVVHYFT